ncbi:dihydroneopterin aldolase [Paracoccus shanxieyensis]|uniref:dihydroneopterin aldolase n=1 Tax=Paracoccus shanxieyensis TaxID=2675752 RepID=A0A6L6ISS6_9RHOB|nr:dihydroneopterin aldolase [Paracoccus shanxieyensis]MTH62651.1 dihydroneopterin aldolase [Paracoccus shanxieyensis]MTH86265.1 dihydroneopterin aldolase [Paracoccus shanxieyensis]
MDQPDRIHLRDYIVSAEIGAFQTERGQEQRLRFNIQVELATHVVGVDDEVDRILSYDILTGAVAAGLADRRYDLLETLAEKIAAQVLAHPRAAQVSVTVEKLDRIPGALGVTLSRRQARVAADATAAQLRVIFHGTEFPLPAGGVALVPDAPGLPLPQGGNPREVELLALDQAAWALAGHLGLTVAATQTELEWAATEGRAVVWAPARMVRDVAGLPSDPHVLALWLADRLQASQLDWALPKAADLPAVPNGYRIPTGRI